MRRLMPWAAISTALFLWIAPAGYTMPASASATSAFSFSWSGGMTAPVTWTGSGASSTWDVLTHRRQVGEDMQPTIAQHGADCSPPPATHMILTLADSVFICRNHVMTSVTDRGYGADVLTPDHMADFASGESVISFSVSTQHLDARDYFDVWVTPFMSNLMVPLTDAVDVQGPPQYAVRVRDCFCGNNTDAFTASVFNNFNETALPTASGTTLQSMLPPSAVTRTGFELHISQNHIKFGIPSVGLWWVDTAASIPFSQGVVQIIHHSYDACKDQSTSTSNPCVADTWHWSNFGISQSVPFTIINGTQRWATPQAATVNFGAPAPANAFLRFEAVSGGMSVSFDGGRTFQAAHQQPIIGDHGNIHADHFTPYFTPVPAGTSSVVFSGQNWYGGAWEVRDPSVWAASGISPIVQPPASNPTPPGNSGGGSTGSGGTGSGGTGSGGTGSGGSGSGGTGSGGTGSGGTGSGGSGSGGTGSGGSGSGGTGSGGTGSGGSSSHEGGSGSGSSGGAEGSGSSKNGGEAPPPVERAQQVVADLVAKVNPTHDPAINVMLLILLIAGVFAVYRVIRA